MQERREEKIDVMSSNINSLGENDHIKSIKSYNNHLLITVHPQSIPKLVGIFRELDPLEFCGAFYQAKGYLELYSYEAVEKFIKVNSPRYLSAELQRNIREIAQHHFNNPQLAQVNNRRLSFFHAQQEKIPLVKLEKMKEWVKDYYPSGRGPLVMDAFHNVFMILFPRDKRLKLYGGYQTFESAGKIEIESLKDKIGKAWLQFYTFHFVVFKAATYSINDFKKMAAHPDLIDLPGWDILNKEKFTLVLQEWLQSILDTKINPVDDQPLSEKDLEKLKIQIEFIEEAFDKLPKEKDVVPMSLPFQF